MLGISVQEVEWLAHVLAKRLMEFNEPIPEFKTRFPNILESCLTAPFQKFGKKYVYPTFLHRAAVLFYLLIKNHPFQNGNKRVAIITLLVFLYKNNKWLNVDIQSFYNHAVWVAQSSAEVRKGVIIGIESFLKKHLVDR